MLTAKQIAEVVTLLKEIEKASLQQWNDPKFVGRIRGEAFIKATELSSELIVFKIAVRDE